jgi:hypothetical protein
MSSFPMSHDQARDFLHKLIRESTKVEGVLLSSRYGFKALVTGKVFGTPDGSIMVLGGTSSTSPQVTFAPAAAISIRYGDDRVMRGIDTPVAERFRREFVCGVTFFFEDGSSAAIFEWKEKD